MPYRSIQRRRPSGLSRRNLLLGAAALAACARTPDYSQAAEQGLGDLAAAKGVTYGAMVTWKSWDGDNALSRDDGFSDLVDHECRLIVAGMEIFWRHNSSGPGNFNFADADRMVDWAQSHKKALRGHNLIWHEQTPKWFAAISGRQEAEKYLVDHVRSMCARYAGRVHSWDVANEILDSSSDRPDGLRDSVFLQHIGPEYLDIAFHTARDADPKALLVVNDYNLEYNVDNNEAKRRAMLGLVDGFKQRGTPVDAVGIQSHLWFDRAQTFDEKVFANFLKEIADRGLQVMITELDVIDRGAPSDIPARDAAVAAIYRQYLGVALDCPATKTVVNWGLSDHDSWITHYNMDEFHRPDGLPPRPLPFDADLKPKPAYNAMADAFRAAPSR